MRGSVANLLRVAVMVALVAMGALVLFGGEAEPPTPPPPVPRGWNDLSEVVAAWEKQPLVVPAPPAGCGLSLSIEGPCTEPDGVGALTGAAGRCARASGRWAFDLGPGAHGVVRCALGACTSRPVDVRVGDTVSPCAEAPPTDTPGR